MEPRAPLVRHGSEPHSHEFSFASARDRHARRFLEHKDPPPSSAADDCTTLAVLPQSGSTGLWLLAVCHSDDPPVLFADPALCWATFSAFPMPDTIGGLENHCRLGMNLNATTLVGGPHFVRYAIPAHLVLRADLD